LLPILTGTLPVFYEICKRSSRFINSCLRSRNNLVRSIALHSIVHGNVVRGYLKIFVLCVFGHEFCL